MKNAGSNWRIIFIILFVASMLFAIGMMYTSGSGIVDNGNVDLSNVDFNQNKLVALDGQWEFYWDRLLMPGDFNAKQPPQMDSLIKVPGTWDDRGAGTKVYPHRGVATYRLRLNYPSTLKDPALRIQNVTNAYKLYANGQLMAEVGKVSTKPSDFKDGEKLLILDLPKDTQELELIFQVANLDYARGGLRQGPVFGSKQVLERQKMTLLALQLFFIGSVFIVSIYYLLLFLLQTKNKTALLFSMLCFITALRSLIWGETPLMIFFPNVSYDVKMYINYLTGYNLMPIMILFVLSIYPLEYTKTTLGLVLLPTLFFDGMLLTPPGLMSSFTNYLYVLILLQMIYIMGVQIKAVLRKRDNAIIMFVAICVFVLASIEDILHYKGIGGINLSYMILYGNFAVIIAMSFVQARQQANTYKKLIMYNENLVEADTLKDKIMATEMSFLQAQIKPHFLYNALNAIANVCEKDGAKAGKLIIDLAIYLRGSLEFNHMDKMVTLEKELEFINTYFNIEQARFGQKIQLLKEIEIPLDDQIPVLILQPLVENAVRHGISKKQGGGRVRIRLMQLEEGIGIEVEDDGIGIEGEKLTRLLSEERKDQGVGLLNIHHRLLRLYGRGLDISSEVGRGTCVILVIPEGRKP
ncbi:histidine kinase [Desulfosporosinus sp. Sb-LF]|nr:histidine kinase [Desulfosporosinus sp. Sb-LF]